MTQDSSVRLQTAEVLRTLNENRNVISHDYAGATVADVFAFCLEWQTELDAICGRVAAYAGRLLAKEK